MYHSVEFDVWDPALQRTRRDSVVVDADSGDDAASQARVKVLGLFPGMGVKIIGIHPCEPPADAEPDMDADGDGVVSKAELLAEAERRGIDVDKRWGVARLREALA